MLEQIKVIAEQFGVELTDTAPKVAKAREKLKCGLDKCICEPNNPERFCISKKCMQDINEVGHCHCLCYKLKGK